MTHHVPRSCLVTLLLAANVVAAQQPQRALEVWPVDEAAQEPALLAVRTAAVGALKRHDIAQLMTLMADDVRQSGNGGDTPEKHRTNIRNWFTFEWGQTQDRSRHLLMALEMGGAFTTLRGRIQGEREFCAPYYYSAFPAELPERPGDPPDLELPWFSSVLIAKGVPVRTKPGAMAPVIARANYSVVIVDTVEGDRDSAGVLWEHITMADGVSGYVSKDVVRSPFDYYICFGDRPGGWKITEFGEGRDILPQ